MDLQTTINSMLTLLTFLGGWVMHSFKYQIQDNKNEIKETKDQLHGVELTVIGKYITKEEFTEHSKIVVHKLDEIQNDVRSCMLGQHYHHQREMDKL